MPHFSAYALTVEPRTALHYAVTQKKAEATDPGQAAGQFEILMERARQMGFDHYEISIFGLPGCHAIHNTNYWMGIPYLGLGPGAHSFNGNSRQWNVANNAQYAAGLLEHATLNMELEQLSDTDTLNEYIMTSLRTMWGMDMAKIELQWGSDVRKKLDLAAQDFMLQKQLVWENDHYRVTDKGKLFADRIASYLFFSGEHEKNR